MRSVVSLAAVVLLAGLVAAPAGATDSRKFDVDVRGRTLTLYVYQPPAGAPAKGTIFMGSGDVGLGRPARRRSPTTSPTRATSWPA